MAGLDASRRVEKSHSKSATAHFLEIYQLFLEQDKSRFLVNAAANPLLNATPPTAASADKSHSLLVVTCRTSPEGARLEHTGKALL
jgi:hypothetical protein